MKWLSWLRHCATSRKVAGSIPDVVTTNCHSHNASGRTVALRFTQLLAEVCARNISWVKSGRCVGMITLLPSCADCLEIWESEPAGMLRAWSGLYRFCFKFPTQENTFLITEVCLGNVEGKGC